MKQVLKTVLWSLLVGIFITFFGLLLFWTTHNSSLEYWFIGFGALMVIAAGLPFVGGNQAAKQDVLYRPSSYMDDYKQSRQSFALSKWTMVMFLIGLPNLLIPLLVIHL